MLTIETAAYTAGIVIFLSEQNIVIVKFSAIINLSVKINRAVLKRLYRYAEKDD
jgi:hypothetical protein